MSNSQSDGRADFDDTLSVVNSQMAPEDLEEFPGNAAQSGESGTQRGTLESDRPISPPTSRQGFGARRGNTLGGGFSVFNNSRPQSAGSRVSHANGPSIAVQGFFRPMSSQRLQAQRNARPFTGAGEDVPGVPRLYSSSVNRPSTDSNNPGVNTEDVQLPPSRGTDHTDHDRIYYNSSINDRNTIHTADSSKPLHDPSQPSPTTPQTAQQTPRDPKPPQPFNYSSTGPSTSQAKPDSASDGRDSADTGSHRMTEKHTKPSVAKAGKNYEYFSGNTVFCWGGRVQNTRHRPVNIFTGLLTVVPAVLFLVFSAPWLWHNVSPALPIVLACAFYICLSSFIHASVTDPGILPRNLHPLPTPETDDPLAVGPPTNDWTMVKSTNPNMTAMDVPTKYCKTCNIWRPLRAHHCRLCDSCIETQDHHCVWINNCVGRRNYRYFFVFVSSAIIAGLLLAFESLGHIIAYSKAESISFRESIDELRIPFAMFIYGIVIIPYPISLTVYHLFLSGRSETTREFLNSHKFLKKDRHRPFNQTGIVSNWAAVFLRSRTPTYLRFKDQYIQGDPRFGSRRGQRQTPLSEQQQGGGLEMHNIPSVPSFQPDPSSLGYQRQ